jgi:hypothetical protein
MWESPLGAMERRERVYQMVNRQRRRVARKLLSERLLPVTKALFFAIFLLYLNFFLKMSPRSPLLA